MLTVLSDSHVFLEEMEAIPYLSIIYYKHTFYSDNNFIYQAKVIYIISLPFG